MKIDLTNLEEKLQGLTGNDFAEAESEERLSGNIMPMIQFSTPFLIRLAARALGINHNDIKALPMNEYAKVAARTSNFLFATSEDDTTDKPASKN